MKELTDIHPPELAARMKLTRGGQAHWAVDITRTCRECKHWVPRKERRFNRKIELWETCDAPTYSQEGELRSRRCAKATGFASRATPLVPHNAFACKYFEAADNPPDVYAPDADAEDD